MKETILKICIINILMHYNNYKKISIPLLKFVKLTILLDERRRRPATDITERLRGLPTAATRPTGRFHG